MLARVIHARAAQPGGPASWQPSVCQQNPTMAGRVPADDPPVGGELSTIGIMTARADRRPPMATAGERPAAVRGLRSLFGERVMLTDDEMREIQAELEHYEHKSAASIEGLKVVQRHRGWVSDESLADLAAVLDMTPAELDSVATFYNLIFRKPVGRHVIMICNSISCWVMGYDQMRDHLTSRLGIEPGQTTADGQFTLLPIVCLGTCDHAPALMIDNDLYTDLDTGKLDEILAKYQ